MGTKRGVLFLVLIGLITLGGCATTGKSGVLDSQGLRNQVLALESQVQEKDREIASLRESLSRVTEEKAALRGPGAGNIVGEIRNSPTMKEIQTALKNAGYDPGNIDGHKGKQTRDAIKAFQKANNLAADGKVGKHTWILLKLYLEKDNKVK